ncbi:hypothetical protein, partial [Clostridium arbusti]|uniref:hypothetical protein n=1 Tax=Clostridium arbusti TaxID=1137848 RepID=UPI00028943A9
MIEFIKSFSNILIEVLIIMFLWSKFFFREKSSLVKNLIIIFINSIIITCIDLMDINTAVGFLITILSVKFIYGKKLINTIFEFAMLVTIIMIIQLMCIFFVQNYIYKSQYNNFYSDFITNIS